MSQMSTTVESSSSALFLKLVLAGLAILLLMLQYRLWFASGNILETRKLQGKLQQQISVNEEQQLRNDSLRAEISALKSDPGEVESRARKELGMVKQGETFFMLVEPPAGERGATGPARK